MQTILGGIDLLYTSIMRVTLAGVDACYSFFIFPVSHKEEIVQEKTEEIFEVEEEIIEEDFSQTSHTFKTVQEILTQDSSVASVQKNTVMYANTIDVPVFSEPTIEFDMQIEKIPYGEMIIILEPRGRFYRIMWRTITGWVLRDDIADRTTRVHPVFVLGEENLVDHQNTAQVRTILKDVFGLGRSEYPLQAGEYVLYRLWKKGISISWPETRPRVPGLWHKILRGVPRVHISMMPKTGSIMEHMLTQDIGHLAYVEAVFPDNTISISEVNNPDSGVYSERLLAQEEWKELKPVFLEVHS